MKQQTMHHRSRKDLRTNSSFLSATSSISAASHGEYHYNRKPKNFCIGLDDWLWMNKQEYFQQQCLEVPNCLRKREPLLVYTRILWLLVLTFEISIDLSQGASEIELPDFSKFSNLKEFLII